MRCVWLAQIKWSPIRATVLGAKRWSQRRPTQDLFICEAYTFDRPVRYHLDYATLCQPRDQLSCRQLVLTHMGRDMLDRVVDTKRAEDGWTLTL